MKTARDLLEQELSRTRLALLHVQSSARDLYERSPVLWLSLDRNYVVLDFNERLRAALGLPEEELLGRPLPELLPEPKRDALLHHLQAITGSDAGDRPGDAPVPPAIELSLAAAAGALDTRATFSVLRAADGAPVELHVLLIDVSEIRRLERRVSQADRLASVGQLAAGVAHEINNPAAWVLSNLGYLQSKLPLLLGERPRDGELREFARDLPALVDQCLSGMRRIKNIVRDLQVFARGADEREADEPLDLNGLCDTVANMAWLEIRRRARLEKCYGALPPVQGRPGKISQVLMNLVINAAQAIPEGQPAQHKIVLHTFEKDGGACVAVRDSGAGIPQAVLARIFDPFFTTKPPGQGTGLGLAICHQIVQQHGGHIDVHSQVGAGSTFTVWLPRARAMAEAVTGPAPQPPSAPADGPRARGKVLVIDDEPDLLRATARTLQGQHEVLLCGSGAEGLSLLRQQRDADVDVIVCDLLMPDLSGMDLYEALPRTLRERFIFVSGDTASAATRAFLEVSGSPHLCKPVEPELLRERIAEAVAQRRARPVGQH